MDRGIAIGLFSFGLTAALLALPMAAQAHGAGGSKETVALELPDNVHESAATSEMRSDRSSTPTRTVSLKEAQDRAARRGIHWERGLRTNAVSPDR